jgi:hypothetical protein
MTPQRKPNWLLYALIAVVVILAVSGLALLGSYFTLARRAAAMVPVTIPTDALQAGAIAPDLAVLTLAGEDDERILRAARDAGETETSYATLAYSTLLADSARSGAWLLLADEAVTRDTARARMAYRVALDMVGLAPNLGDLARADIALQAADGFFELKQQAVARMALEEAEQIARHGLSLLPAQRRAILVRVVAMLRRMGEMEAAQALSDELASASLGPGVEVQVVEPMLLALRGSSSLPPEVAVAVAARQQAAAALAARWLAEPEPERAALATALGDALQAEDAARMAAYARLGDLAPADRLALLHDRAHWLTIKHRAARGAYGTSLVPVWEGDATAIAQELAATYTELINGYGRQVDTLPAEQQETARVELLRMGLLWSRLGLFPGDAENVLAEQLTDALGQLRTQMGNAGLAIQPHDAAGYRFYVLSGPDGLDKQQAETAPSGG